MLFSNAQFISYPTGEKKDAYSKYGNPCPYFRKTFCINKEINKALLYASAIGVFKAYINGQEVDSDFFSPGWTDYRVNIPYMVFNVTDKIKTNNAIGIVAGDGWAVGCMGNYMFRCNYFDEIEIIASLQIEYDDGTIEYINTDESWKASSGEIIRSDIYMGEYIDRRKTLGNFSEYDYDDSNWGNIIYQSSAKYQGVATPQYLKKAIAPKTTVKHILDAEFMYNKDGKLLYDFKQNFTGVAKAVINGQEGSKITFRYGEMLNNDGSLYVGNLRRAEATDIYILNGEIDQIFRPLFTFHGFRYMEVDIEGKAELTEIKGLAMYTDLEETGSFECSDKIVSKIYQNTVWGQRGNFLNVPTDCPQRDERLGWTGDAQIFCGSAMFNMDCKTFFEKYICDVRDSQLSNGGVPSIAPVVPHANYTTERHFHNAAGWGDVMTVIPYEHYLMYGDKKIISDNMYSIKRFIDFSINNSENYIRPAEYNFGDWLSIGEETDKSVLNTMYFAYSTLLTAKMCKILNDADAAFYYDLYKKIKNSFRNTFIDKDFKIKSDTQTCYLLAYSFGLLTNNEVKSNLLNTIHRSNDHLSTGFLGVKFLLPVLCDIGESKLAYKLLTNKTYPSWGYSVVNGATTIWERWNSYTKEKGFERETMNSFNHYALGSCCEWMFKYCLGIMPSAKPYEAGFKKIILKPYFDINGIITSAKGSYNSINGKIDISWNKQNDCYIYKAVVDGNIKTEFDFSEYGKWEKIEDNLFKITLKES